MAMHMQGLRVRVTLLAGAAAVVAAVLLSLVQLRSDRPALAVPPTPTPTAKFATDGNLSGVYDVWVTGGTPGTPDKGISVFHCIMRQDHDATTHDVKTAAQCVSDLSGLGDTGSALYSINVPGEGPDGNPGPPPPPPYNIMPPAKGLGTYDPGTDTLTTTTCFPDVGAGTQGPNTVWVVTIPDAKAQSLDGKAEGSVLIYFGQTNADCTALTPSGTPLAALPLKTYNINGPVSAPWRTAGDQDYDNDGCTDFQELDKQNRFKCGDDPWNPYDSGAATNDMSGSYELLVRMERADLADAGSYFNCLADLQQTGDGKAAGEVMTRLSCYVDIGNDLAAHPTTGHSGITVNKEAAGGNTACPPAAANQCGDGFPGPLPPGYYAPPKGQPIFGDGPEGIAESGAQCSNATDDDGDGKVNDGCPALDAPAQPVVSYYDVTNGNLKVLYCGDASCTAGNSVQSPDMGGDVGRYTSLVLDAAGRPVVAYWDDTNSRLKVLHCGNANCTAGNSVQAPDIAGIAGIDVSLALDAVGNPVISYSDITNSDLRLLHCNDPDCAIGIPSMTAADAAAAYTSLALDAAGNPVVSYYDTNSHDLKVWHTGVGGSLTAPDTNGDVGQFTSLALDAAGNPVVSYYDNTLDDLKVLHCNDANCDSAVNGAESIESPDMVGNVGYATSLALDGAGRPVVSYYAPSDDNLKVLHCNDVNCAGGDESPTLADTTGNVGEWSSVALDEVGRPVVSYYDNIIAGNGDLKVLHCGNVNCTAGNSVQAPDTGGDVGQYTSLALVELDNAAAPETGSQCNDAVDANEEGAPDGVNDGCPGVAQTHAELGFIDNATNTVHILRCFIDPDGTFGNTYWQAVFDKHTGIGTVDIWLIQPGANCLAGTPVGGPIFNDAELFAVRQALPTANRDTDQDGCPDRNELSDDAVIGGLRDPYNPWDYFNPLNNDINRTGDITAVVLRYGHDDGTGDPLYGQKYDRGGQIPGGNKWNLRPPDGQIRTGDITSAVNSYGHDCGVGINKTPVPTKTPAPTATKPP